jgi:hypothetical protein
VIGRLLDRGLGWGLRRGLRKPRRLGLGLGVRRGLRARLERHRPRLRTWARRLRWFRIVLVILMILGAQRVLTGTPDDALVPVAGSGSFTDLAIYLPTELDVAQPVTADVVGSAPGAEVTLLIGGTLGNLTLTGTASGSGVTRFVVPPSADRWSGEVSLVARAGSATGQGSFQLLPGPVTGPVTTVIGPSSIVADGIDASMGVAIPMDRFGNAPEDGTTVRFRRVRPSGQVKTTTTQTAHLLAWEGFTSGTLAGGNQIHAEQGSATGPGTGLAEGAGPPVGFKLGSQRLIPAADGRSLLQVRTSVLRDEHGNPEADGTLVTLFGNGPVGSWRIPGATVGGIARFTIEAPVSPGTVQLTAHCRGAVSLLPLTIAFAQNGSTMSTVAERRDDDIIVTVGPVIDRHGAQVDDGAVITAVARDGAGTEARSTLALVEGSGQLRIAAAALSGPVSVSVSLLGIQSTISVP